MASLKPFRAYRPVKDQAFLVASVPYDVISSNEAKELVKRNPISFLRITKPEVDFARDHDPYGHEVYIKGEVNFRKACEIGLFKQDEKDCLYVYMLEKDGKQQTGLVGCVGIEDYFSEVIKKHELTRPDKEEDRKNHIRFTNMHAEPVLFAYHADPGIDRIITAIKDSDPEYDFIATDRVRHVVWVISEQEVIDSLVNEFEKIPHTYVADGHHRTAASAILGRELRHKNPHHQGIEEYNYFMAVHFPHDQLQIIDYNRLVKDLNGLSRDEFLNLLSQSFDIKSNGPAQYKPQKPHEISMYLEGNWCILRAKPGTWEKNDPVGSLDVTILYEQILRPILGIGDLRTDKRIDFAGGSRGLDELEKRVNSGEMKVAFALYPVTMEQLMETADSDRIMPPKTTWFEPKLRSGLFVHKLD
ncbi:MAG: DUF1015 domain-containing protein [Cyclobacteriaceae bacterium]|nr:DUF1015 domain-containing protein [Cyclobacteriaceae bacterium]